jgi:hypothetical protein
MNFKQGCGCGFIETRSGSTHEPCCVKHLGVVVKGSVSDVRMPEGIRRDQFLAWVEQLEDRTTPDWLGLPNNAERVLLANRGQL